jgi:hypothetical protein
MTGVCFKENIYVRIQVFAAVTMRISNLLGITVPEEYVYSLHLQVRSVSQERNKHEAGRKLFETVAGSDMFLLNVG